MEGKRGEPKAKKKLWVQGLFVAHARYEGQGNMLLCTSTVATVNAREKTHLSGTMVRGKVPQSRTDIFISPLHICSFPRFAKRIAGRPFFSRDFFFPNRRAKNNAQRNTERSREADPDQRGNEGGDEASGRGWERYCLD